MGINNLLQTLNNIKTKTNLSKFSGKILGIDTYCLYIFNLSLKNI